ncbi:MAG: hypothetical protein H6998_07120 [Hahellaceae bacterium]|nr:hypothetical protein [Hahellaceae bacterium]
MVAGAIGVAQFVTTLGEGITRPLDIASNLAQVAAGVDDQQVRDELAGTKQAISNTADFVVNGDYAEAAKNAHQVAVNETVKALEGDVTATSNVTQAVLAVATLKSAAKGKPKITKESSSGPNAKVVDSLAARADAEAGMPYSHPVKPSQPKTWNEFQAATKGQFSSRKEAGEAWRALKGPSQTNTSASVHKNSLDYVGETHVYRIKSSDGTYKIGESAQGTRVSDGASIRAEQQARELTLETGKVHTTKIINAGKPFKNKREAVDYQDRVRDRFRRLYGEKTLPGNQEHLRGKKK